MNAAIDFASFDFGHLETLEKVRGRIGFSILRPTHSRFLPARFNSLANVPLYRVKFINRKKISHPFLFRRRKIKRFKIIIVLIEEKAIRKYDFLISFRKKRPKTLVSSNFNKKGQTLSEKNGERERERERKEGEVGEVARGVADESEGAKKKVGPVNGT